MGDVGGDFVPILPVVDDDALLRKDDQIVANARDREIIDDLGTGVIAFARRRDHFDDDHWRFDDQCIGVRLGPAVDENVGYTQGLVVDRYADTVDEDQAG